MITYRACAGFDTSTSLVPRRCDLEYRVALNFCGSFFADGLFFVFYFAGGKFLRLGKKCFSCWESNITILFCDLQEVAFN